MAFPLDPEKLQESLAQTMSKADKAAEAGGKWLDAYIEQQGIDRDTLTKLDWFRLTRLTPCRIRCWRVGGPVTVEPGDPCPECGKIDPLPTVWDRLMEG